MPSPRHGRSPAGRDRSSPRSAGRETRSPSKNQAGIRAGHTNTGVTTREVGYSTRYAQHGGDRATVAEVGGECVGCGAEDQLHRRLRLSA